MSKSIKIVKRLQFFVATWGSPLVLQMVLQSAIEASPQTISEITREIEAAHALVLAGRLVVQRLETVSTGQSPSSLDETEIVEFAWDGNQRFLKSKEFNQKIVRETADGGVVEPSSVSDIVTRRVFDGQRLLSLRGGGIGELHTAETKAMIGGSSFDVFYLRCIGWYILDPTANTEFETRRKAHYLPLAFSTGNYAVSEETIEGASCLRLTGKLPSTGGLTDTIWLSPDHRFMIVQRYTSDSDGNILYRVTTKEPLHVAPGLWLPKYCDIQENSGHGDEGSKTRLIKHTRLVLLEFQIGKVDTKLFSIDIPAGAMIADYTIGKRRDGQKAQPAIRKATADGWDFDRAVKMAEKPSVFSSWLVWANIAVVVVLITMIFLRRLSKAAAST